MIRIWALGLQSHEGLPSVVLNPKSVLICYHSHGKLMALCTPGTPPSELCRAQASSSQEHGCFFLFKVLRRLKPDLIGRRQS